MSGKKKSIISKIVLFLLEFLFPIIIIGIAIIFSLEPEFYGIKIEKDNIFLAFFSILAIDSILNKIISKRRISDKLENIHTVTNETNCKIQNIEKEMSIIQEIKVLKSRSDFGRLEHVFASAKKELFVSGINLEGIVPSCNVLKDLAKRNVYIRLLMLDPAGKSLSASSDMSGVRRAERKKKIKANLDFLCKEFEQEIKDKEIEIRIIDSTIPMSFIGIDSKEDFGRIIVQNYLFKTPSSRSLMLDLSNNQLYWYKLYSEQMNLIWENGKKINDS